MEKIILLVLICLCCVFVTENIAETLRHDACETDWYHFNSSCYSWYPPKRNTLDAARNLCEKLNGHLARVVTKEIYQFIKDNVLKTTDSTFWSALHRCHSSWYFWTDGSAMSFSNFKLGEPNNHKENEHCIEIYSDATWNDQDCSKPRGFICQNLTCSRANSDPAQSCLYVNQSKTTWFEADELCQLAGDTLVKITNTKMNLDARLLARESKDGCWIGLRKQDVLCWGDGEQVLLRNGHHGSCDDSSESGRCNCVAMGDSAGTWIKVPCDAKQPFVCEKDANECNDPDNICHKDSVCINTVGAYTCLCKNGFIGNGEICVEPNNFDMSMMNMTDKNEIRSVIKSCANELENGNETEALLKILENITLSVGQHLKHARHINGTATFILNEKNIILGVVIIEKKKIQSFTYPDDVHGLEDSDEKIVFPGSIVLSGNNGSVVVVGMVYDTPTEISSLQDESKWFINSKTVAGIVDPKPEISRQNPVKIVFKKLKRVENSQVKCVYWKFRKGMKGMWSSEGCHVSNSNDSHVICECYHLTNFAILVRIKADKVSEKDSVVLIIITFVGLSTSIIGCFLTLVIHLCFRKLRRDRGFIHINLVFALGLADIVFMIAILSDPVDSFCIAMALLIFYFFLALFFWMLVEGLHIYFMVAKVFDTKGRKTKFYYSIIGWILPLVIVLVTYASLRSDVLSDEYCWLSISSGAIWSFVGPITIIILINVIIMILVLKMTLTVLPEDPENGRIKSAFRTFVMLTPLLGVTWIFGLLTITEYSTVFQYLFAILNSFQGLTIFVLYCLFNKEARRELKRKITVMRSSRDITLSRRKSSLSIKNKMSTRTLSKSSLGVYKGSGDNSMSGRYTPRTDRSNITDGDPSSGNGAAYNVNYGLENEKLSPADIYPLEKTSGN